MGAAAVAVSAIFLVLLLSTIVSAGDPGAAHELSDAATRSFAGKGQSGKMRRQPTTTRSSRMRCWRSFPDVTGRQDRRLVRGLISTGAGTLLRKDVAERRCALGGTVDYALPLDDFADLYMKGLLAGQRLRRTLSTPR